MVQRTQQQSLQGTAGVSLAGESKRAKKAGKEDAKLKADPRGQTEKNKEAETVAFFQNGFVNSASQRRFTLTVGRSLSTSSLTSYLHFFLVNSPLIYILFSLGTPNMTPGKVYGTSKLEKKIP